MNMFNILIIQLPAKGGETEGEQQGEGRDMFRPRPNNKELHKHTDTYTVTPSHSGCITHCSPMFHPAHILLTTQCHHKGGVHWKTTAWKHLTLFLCLCVCRFPQSDELRAGCLSWEGGTVTVVTDMPKPDLLCLVQLLDGTIETFRVSVCNTHTHTHTASGPLLRSCVAPICLCALLMIVVAVHDTVTDYSFLRCPIDPHFSFNTVTLVWRTRSPPAAYLSCHTYELLHHQRIMSYTAWQQ